MESKEYKVEVTVKVNGVSVSQTSLVIEKLNVTKLVSAVNYGIGNGTTTYESDY